MTAGIRTVPFTTDGCVLHASHRPRPSRLEAHHVLPKYLAARVGAETTETVLVCSDGHNDVHIAINAMLVQGPMPKGIGAKERKYARKALVGYVAAGGTVPL